MSRRAQRITVTTIGAPPLEGAEAFARLMATVLSKQPDPSPGKPVDGAVPTKGCEQVTTTKIVRQDGQENS